MPITGKDDWIAAPLRPPAPLTHLADATNTHGPAALLAEVDLLQAMLDHLPDCVYFKDRLSRFVLISRAMAGKFGLSDPAEAIGKTDFDFFTPEHAAPALAAERQILRTGVPLVDLEEKETWPDGTVTWVTTSKLPLRDGRGVVVGTFGLSRDITARKRAEEERRQMEARLQLGQRLEWLGRLSAGVAHEINTPTQYLIDNHHFLISTLSGTGAAADPAAGAEVPGVLAQNLEGLERIARIVRSLTEFSLPQGQGCAPSDLNRVVETALAVSRHQWSEAAEIVTQLDPGLPAVPCFVDDVNQILLQLLANAAQAIARAAMPRSGRGTITVRTRHDRSWATLEVADTGSGIAPEHRAHVFEPFFTTQAPGRGLGQGLAIVHSLVVQRHGGRVDFDCGPAGGTTFRVQFPLGGFSPS